MDGHSGYLVVYLVVIWAGTDSAEDNSDRERMENL